MTRFPTRFVSVAVAAGLVLAACGSDEANEASKGTVGADVATTSTTEATTTTTAEVTTTSTTEATTTTSTTEATTTTTAAPAAAGPSDGVFYTDPAGEYALLIGPEWTDGGDQFPAGVKGWFTGQDSADFVENINILTDTVPSLTPLEAILDASITQLQGQFEGFSLIRSDVVPGVNHPQLGILEYTATQSGIDIHFVQVFGVWDDTLVVFTGSADARNGTEGADRLRPYALTLSPAG